MTRTTAGSVREYYRQITDIDIGRMAREILAERIVQEGDRLLQCDCPNHKSSSHRSLHILLDKQGWYCFGCGVGGDVLQLVEFVQSGTVTSGQSGPMPESHQRARDFLAAKAQLPPLALYGLSPERLRKAEAVRELDVRVQEALTALASFYHRRLKDAPEVLEWLTSHYGIGKETIDALRIGYAANGPCKDDGKPQTGVLSALTTGENPFTSRELDATGAFRPTGQAGLIPFFDGRIVFPYWSHGRVVFLIGRKTPWTPDRDWEKGSTASCRSTTASRTGTSLLRSTTATSTTRTACSPGPRESLSPKASPIASPSWNAVSRPSRRSRCRSGAPTGIASCPSSRASRPSTSARTTRSRRQA